MKDILLIPCLGCEEVMPYSQLSLAFYLSQVQLLVVEKNSLK